jgi:murein DD-endopeptidase MepM/ murein hydrolase activator NlpD
MAINVNLAPYINEEFVVTGAWGEQRSDHIHAGIDMQTRKAYQTGVGQPVYSMCNGYVTTVASNSGYGPYVIIYNPTNHDLWLFGDMDSNRTVVTGQTVTQGQQIGYEGNPAGTASTGLHIHMERENHGNSQWYGGYRNSVDPVAGTGIRNERYSTSGEVYIYDGTPVPPGPTPGDEDDNSKKWFRFKKRKATIIM